MNIRKNLFVFFSLSIYVICLLFALFSGILNLGNSKTYPYLWYAGTFIAIGLLLLILHLLPLLAARLNISSFFSKEKRRSIVIEAVLATIIIFVGAALRMWIIQNVSITPSSDYQTYYQVAQLLSKGTLASAGPGFCDYISEFPHVIGYPFVLSLLFRITGASVAAGLYLNLAASVISIFLVYRISRLICGRVGGLIALTLAALWPSQILYSNILASEPVFTCMMLFSIWIAVKMFYYPAKTGKISICIFQSIALGISIALASAVRPLAQILLIAIILCLIPCRVKFSETEKVVGAFRRGVCQGFFRALLVLIGYFICAQIISGSIVNTIHRTLPSSSVSFGYNLLVGVNIKSSGTWNEKDAVLLSDTYTATSSAQAAHKACLTLALERIHDNPTGVLNLTLEKVSSLWGNDDYGASWNLLFLDQQKHLTTKLKDFINNLSLWNNILYMTCLFFSAIAGIFLWFRKKGSPAQILILFFIGTLVVQMVLECQNRYHYNVLPIFMILASVGITEFSHKYIYNKSVKKVTDLSYDSETLAQVAATQQPAAANQTETESSNKFDMLKAISDGHITVVVTEQYRKEAESEVGQAKPSHDEDTTTT